MKMVPRNRDCDLAFKEMIRLIRFHIRSHNVIRHMIRLNFVVMIIRNIIIFFMKGRKTFAM